MVTSINCYCTELYKHKSTLLFRMFRFPRLVGQQRKSQHSIAEIQVYELFALNRVGQFYL